MTAVSDSARRRQVGSRPSGHSPRLPDSAACGPNPERQAQCIHAELEAGYDEVHVNQFGSDWTGYFDFFGKKVRPRLGA